MSRGSAAPAPPYGSPRFEQVYQGGRVTFSLLRLGGIAHSAAMVLAQTEQGKGGR